MSARSLVLSVLFLALQPGLTRAQTFQGGIRGTVRDPEGIVVGASVQLVEENTGLDRTVVTNGRGGYAFTNVWPGTYRLSVAVPGFRAYERKDLRVGTQTFLIVDVRLEIGALSDTVVVQGQAPLVEMANPAAGTLLERRTLQGLPSAGRNVFFMSTLTPTVVATGDAQFVRQQDQSNASLISLGGGPRRNNSYVLDGVPIADILNRAVFVPSLEAIDEMRVQLGAYDAEVGRTSGGVFNVTARSGSNTWQGSALYQNRPGWGQGRLFFARQHDIPNPDTYYHLYGGAAGGPLVRNRTFFYASTEGYRTATARNTVLVLPTEAERRGDFSQSNVIIYDPLTTRPDPDEASRFIRDPFPGNRIPEDRLNPVSLALLEHLPMPTAGQSRPAVARIVDRADQITGKVTHRWSNALTSTGLYAWYESMEPDARFYGEPLFGNAADPGDGALVRRVHMMALTTTWAAGPSSAVDVRYGFSRFLDDNRPAPFDPGPLGFSPEFLGAVPLRKFPGIGVAGYGRGGSLLGDREQSKATYSSQTASATVARLAGRHAVKAGGEYRQTGVRFLNVGGTGGYTFNRDFTFGPNPNAPNAGTGDAFASFLLGFPASGSIAVSSPIDVRLDYWSVFAQDDVRLTPKLTLSLGLRYEYESGLRERDRRMAVGWAFDAPFPIQVGGLRPDGSPLLLTGGLRYAGVDGAPTYQGEPNPWQLAPRASVAYAADDRTAVRAGYGLFRAPMQGISADEIGSGTPGYNQTTTYVATGANPFVPCAGCSIANPFPAGITQPPGNSAGRLTGVGGNIWFVDPRSRAAHFHRYSFGAQRDLGGRVVVGLGYLGVRGENLTGGVSGGPININQLDPAYAALGTALQEPVPNSFFGTPLAVGILAGPTIARGQLLRPYPQFDVVYATRASVARSRYRAFILEAERRPGNGWSARASYTWSRLEDSQYAESNFFAGGSALLDNHDVDREFALSVVDAPHRLNVMAIVELPWDVQLSATGSYQSGFPVSIVQSPNNSNLFGSTQRPNVVPGVDPRLTTSPEDNYDASCGCIRWLNPAAWSQAPPFTFGNAPRTDGRVRTPIRRNWDVAFQKAVSAGETTLTVRAEVINVFDFADFRGPGIVFGDASFGQIREAAGFPRTLQLSARMAW